MTLTVRARADAVATFRFVSVYLMETLARWVPTTPELEVKVLFGRHLWELAQHADAFGRRTAELRLGPHASREPVTAFQQTLKRFAATAETAARVDGFYAGAVPLLEALYRDYLARTDALLDEPSVRVLERALADLARLQREREELRRERPEIALSDPGGPQRLARAAQTLDAVVDFRPAAPHGAEA
jgi:hypothetical protein